MDNVNAVICASKCQETLRMSQEIAGHIADIIAVHNVGIVEACGRYLSIVASTCEFIVEESKQREERDDADDDGAEGR